MCVRGAEVAEKAVRQHVEACFAALDARLAEALDEAAAATAAEPSNGALPHCLHRGPAIDPGVQSLFSCDVSLSPVTRKAQTVRWLGSWSGSVRSPLMARSPSSTV